MENQIIPYGYSESQVPSIMEEQFRQLQAAKSKVSIATNKAEIAKEKAKKASEKSAGIFHRKETIEALQDASVDLADAQVAAADAQEISFEYQQKLGEMTKYLFRLGVTNIAMNRSVVRELELKLQGASAEELDEFARQELLGVLKQLKAQEDIMKKQSVLSEQVKEHERLIAERIEKDQQQDDELSRQAAKDVEHDLMWKFR